MLYVFKKKKQSESSISVSNKYATLLEYPSTDHAFLPCLMSEITTNRQFFYVICLYYCIFLPFSVTSYILYLYIFYYFCDFRMYVGEFSKMK